MASYFQHKLKCMSCGLHYIVCSDYQKWPEEGSTREQNVGEATGQIYCPECGSNGIKVHWVQETEGFIFQSVPGEASMEGFTYPVTLDQIEEV